MTELKEDLAAMAARSSFNSVMRLPAPAWATETSYRATKRPESGRERDKNATP